MTDCKRCQGQQLVCENHVTVPWGDGDGCCGSAGSPCPACCGEYYNKVEVDVLGRKIRNLRINQEVFMLEFAGSIGIPVTKLSAIENGRHSPSIHLLRKISGALGVSFDFLVSPELVPLDSHCSNMNEVRVAIKKIREQ